VYGLLRDSFDSWNRHMSEVARKKDAWSSRNPDGAKTMDHGLSSSWYTDKQGMHHLSLANAQAANKQHMNSELNDIMSRMGGAGAGNVDSALAAQAEHTAQTLRDARDDRAWALGQRNQLTGLTDTMVRDAQNFNTEARRSELAGQASADVSNAWASAQQDNAANMARMGINPADAKYGAANAGQAANMALARANAYNNARGQAREEGRQLQDRAAGALAAAPGLAMQASESGSRMAAEGVNTAMNNRNTDPRNAILGALAGKVIGGYM